MQMRGRVNTMGGSPLALRCLSDMINMTRLTRVFCGKRGRSIPRAEERVKSRFSVHCQDQEVQT